MKELVPFLPAESTSIELSRRELSRPAAYALLHPSTGGVYAGSTGDLYHRISQHRTKLRTGTHSNRNLQAAYDQNPTFTLRFKITETVEEAIVVEQTILDTFLPLGNLLNVSTDATKGGKGHVVSDSAKERIRQASQLQFSTEDSREAQSDRSRKKWEDPEFRAKHIGRAESLEKKQQISSSLKVRWKDPEYRNRALAERATRRKPVTIDGVDYPSVNDAVTALNIPRSTLFSRLKKIQGV